MAGGGFATSGGGDFEAKITPIVIISCIMAATGGLMFGYDVGVSGGVTSMPPFLKKFFPAVYRKTVLEKGLDSNYCKYDNQGLQLFTSSLYLAGLTATFFASYTTRVLGRRITMLIAGFFFSLVELSSMLLLKILPCSLLEESYLVVVLVLLIRLCQCFFLK
jgi:hypothetical protein